MFYLLEKHLGAFWSENYAPGYVNFDWLLWSHLWRLLAIFAGTSVRTWVYDVNFWQSEVIFCTPLLRGLTVVTTCRAHRIVVVMVTVSTIYRWNSRAVPSASTRLTTKRNIYPLSVCAIIIVSNNNTTRNGRRWFRRHQSREYATQFGRLSVGRGHRETHDWCALNVSTVCQTVSMRAQSVRVSFTPPVALMSPPQRAAALICAARYHCRAPVSTRRRAADHVDSRMNGVRRSTSTAIDRQSLSATLGAIFQSIIIYFQIELNHARRTRWIQFRANQRSYRDSRLKFIDRIYVV